MTRPRIRTLKPECWQDEAIGALSDKARLLWVGLVTMADDAGRLRLLPSAVIGHVFPYDESVTAARLRKLLAECTAAVTQEGKPLVMVYEHGGATYAWLTGWRKHQRINRVTPSELPPPPDPDGSWPPHDLTGTDSVNDPHRSQGVPQ